MYKWTPDESIGFALTAVKEVNCSEGPKYFLEDPNDSQNWRWLTNDEKAEYLASKETHDEARATDDGMGAAIGAAADVPASLLAEGNTSDIGDDLGTKWGESSAVPQTVTEAYEAGTEINFTGGVGHEAFNQTGEVAVIARKMLEEALADPMHKRFALVTFDMENVDPETTAGDIGATKRISTVDDGAIIQYASALAFEKLVKSAKRSELEI